ncbi:tripartite tricarboxylate transporter substrate binding protein [Caldimonas brevitalea]|uniref:MFS transporter n=1 Tax=Caldimonas brevitalea TaxID=413882 RepID=A0A0G3BPT9_9BURK|nr:tripartite tricarboxylate transporter substrate binding protein [Caldimonas brevitalea]AKJ31427.1 MFS transporter [Caldimonas brevitalea]
MSSPVSTRRRFLMQAAGGLSAAALSAPVFAQAGWPSKPIRLVVPYPPGGFTDVTARLIARGLQQRLGQTVNVDNKAGANGIIGVDAVAKSPGDGGTFGVVIAAHAANTTLYPKLPYDPTRDLTGVSLIGISPLVAAVHNEAPFKTAREMIEYARRQPGKVSFGSSGNGSAAHLSTELLKALTQTYMVHIPYRGAAAALTDLIGGQIQLFLDAASGLIQPGKQGRVRLIGVASEKRLAALPEVPTFIEQGIAGFTGSTWAGVIAPAATPREIVQKVADEVAQIVREDEVRQRLEAMGTVPVGNTPKEFNDFIAAETAKWGRVIRTAKVQAE